MPFGQLTILKPLPIPEAGMKVWILLTAAKSNDWKYLKEDSPLSQMKISIESWSKITE